MPDYYIGLMSGTSLDAIDAVLLDTSNQPFQLINTWEHPIPSNIQAEILALCLPGDNEIDRMGQLDNRIGRLFAQAVNQLLSQTKLPPEAIRAIGSHGQTIRHRPGFSESFTLQIGNPALITELTGITTVADFRRADMAAGGQGAPLAPAFHQAAFEARGKNRVIVNIGGMANITVLENQQVQGFDTGPGNALLNSWARRHIRTAYDRNGAWAKQYSVNAQLLTQMLADPYFQQPPPKSTGRETFNDTWLNEQIQNSRLNLEPGVIQATLTALTAVSIANAIKQYSDFDEVYVCGGGVHNAYLLELLSRELQTDIHSTQQLGIDPDYVEAAAFAWFAHQALIRQPANLPSVTGASHPVILGGIYPRWDSGT